MGAFDGFIRGMAGNILEYVMRYLPFNHTDTGTGNSIRVERGVDGGIRVITYKGVDGLETVVNVSREVIDRHIVS